ncbi:MAG: carbon-nitrogen hydrolase family protein [Limisphaerales bacterium]
MNFKLALVQMRVEGGRKAANLERAEARIAEAARAGADLALLPEALDLGWTDPSATEGAEPIPGGEPVRRLAQAAREHRIFVCAGLTEKDAAQVYNSAVILDRHGRLLGTHRKLNELAIGHSCYAQGDHLNVVPTELGTLGLMICADGFARDRVLSRALGYMGAEVILSPCAWAVPADHDPQRTPYGDVWRDAYLPVAREFAMWIAGASNVGPIAGGPWAGRKCIGSSLVIGPRGEEVALGPYGEDADCVLYVNVVPVPRPARGCGWEDRPREGSDTR